MERRLDVLEAVERGALTSAEAASLLDVTPAQLTERLAVLALSRELLARDRARPSSKRAAVLALAALTVTVGGFSLAANGTCPNGLPFCFTADSPAVAEEMNMNFSQLKEWLEAKTGPVSSAPIGTAPLTAGAVTVSNLTASTTVTASGGVTAGTLSVTNQTAVVAGSLNVPGLWVPVARTRLTGAGELTVAVPGGYRMLKLVFKLSSDNGSTRYLFVQFNNDTSNAYNREFRDLWNGTTYNQATNAQSSGILSMSCQPIAAGQVSWTAGEVLVHNDVGATHVMVGTSACHSAGVILLGGITFSQYTNTAEINSVRIFSDPFGGASTALTPGSELTVMGLR